MGIGGSVNVHPMQSIDGKNSHHGSKRRREQKEESKDNTSAFIPSTELEDCQRLEPFGDINIENNKQTIITCRHGLFVFLR